MSDSYHIALPLRRLTDLVMTETSSDTVIYDRDVQSIHTLNAVTTAVWRTLDGEPTLGAVMASTGQDELVVRKALTQLADAGLLDGALPSGVRVGHSRRDLLKKAGLAAAIPVLISVSAPMAASAASCDTFCQPLTGQCLTGGGNCYVCVPISFTSGYCGFPIGARGGDVSPPDAGWVASEEQRLLDEWVLANPEG